MSSSRRPHQLLYCKLSKKDERASGQAAWCFSYALQTDDSPQEPHGRRIDHGRTSIRRSMRTTLITISIQYLFILHKSHIKQLETGLLMRYNNGGHDVGIIRPGHLREHHHRYEKRDHADKRRLSGNGKTILCRAEEADLTHRWRISSAQRFAYDQSFPVGCLFRHAEHQPAYGEHLYGFPESSITAQRSLKQE